MKLKGFDAYMEPCPFCGNDNLSARFSCEVIMVKLRVKCNKCGAEITFAPNVSEIWVANMIVDRRPEYDPLEHWNARAEVTTENEIKEKTE